jgi:Uma2 family endonuclease
LNYPLGKVYHPVSAKSIMATITPTTIPDDWTVADMLVRLGGVSPKRILMKPTPGDATEEDLVAVHARSGRICELIDGVLVEKIMGAPEALLAGFILHLFWNYLEIHDLGIVLAPDGLLRILGRQVRAPDVSFIRWERFVGRQVPREQIFPVAPDLAIEILSPGNTKAEMSRKLRDYFTSGVRLVWYIDPDTRTAWAYTAEDRGIQFGAGEVLAAGDVLPGFELSLATLFAKLDREGLK